MFLLLHFLLPQKLLEGFCRDSSDCSIRRFTDFLATEQFITLFSGTRLYFLLIMRMEYAMSAWELSNTLYFFPLPPPLLSSDFCSHPYTDLSFTKKL
jgi:hypothetical protein